MHFIFDNIFYKQFIILIFYIGKLTYWLAQAIKLQSGSTLLLIDRSSHRHKKDNKLKNEDNPLNVKRIRADIADLKLNKLGEIGKLGVVGVAKHLCGAATGNL